MIKILNIFRFLEGIKVFLEVVDMVCRGVREGMQHFRNKSNETDKTSDVTPERNNPAEE